MADFSEQDLTTFRTLLEERAVQLRGEVQDARNADQADQEGFVGVAPDLVDIAEAKLAGDIRNVEAERDRLELTEIELARERLNDGTYGDCIDCDDPIAIERLRAQPWASRCIECQERYEQRANVNPVPLVPTGLDNRAR